MISIGIQEETVRFFQAVALGIVLSFSYDLLRAFRKAVSHSTAAVAAEDLLYWIFASFSAFLTAHIGNQGVLRIYAAGGVCLGAVFYLQTAGRSVRRAAAALFGQIGRAAAAAKRRIRAVLLEKPAKIWRRIQKKIENRRENRYNETAEMCRKTVRQRGIEHGRKKKRKENKDQK